MTTQPLTQDDIKAAYNALEEYDMATMKRGEEPHYPVWAANIVKQSLREGLIETAAEARTA